MELWSRCLDLEKELKTCLSKNKPQSPEASTLFTRIKESFARVVAESVTFALGKEFETCLWRSIHRLNEEYRKSLKRFLSKTPGNDREEHKKALAAYQGFLLEASGFYVSMIEKLQSSFRLTFSLNEPFLCKGDSAQKDKYLALESCHRIFIYLGDLARYKEQSSETSRKNWSASHEYYIQAIRTLPFSGNPFNQLAVLATYADLEYKCVFNYYMGLLIEMPFTTIKDNLGLQFLKNKTKYLELVEPRLRDESAGREPALDEDKVLKSYHIHFIRMHGILFTLTDEDDFHHVREQTFKTLGQLLHRRSKPLDIYLLEASLIISMGTPYYLRNLKGQTLDQAVSPQAVEENEKHALSVLFTLFNHLLIFTKTLCLEVNQKRAGQSTEKVISLLEPSLPLIKLISDWIFANQPHWTSFSPTEVGGLNEFWENFSSCLNALFLYSPVDFSHKHNIPLPEEVQYRCYLPLQASYVTRNWAKARSPTNAHAFKETHDLRLKSIYGTATFFVQKQPPTLHLAASGSQPYRFVNFTSAAAGPSPAKSRQLVNIPTKERSRPSQPQPANQNPMDFSMNFVDEGDTLNFSYGPDSDGEGEGEEDGDGDAGPKLSTLLSPIKMDSPKAAPKAIPPSPSEKAANSNPSTGGRQGDEDDEMEQIVYTGRHSKPQSPLPNPAPDPVHFTGLLSAMALPQISPIGSGIPSQGFAPFSASSLLQPGPQALVPNPAANAAPPSSTTWAPWLSHGQIPTQNPGGQTREILNPYFQSDPFGASPFAYTGGSLVGSRPQVTTAPIGIPVPSLASVPLEHPTLGQGYFSFLGSPPGYSFQAPQAQPPNQPPTQPTHLHWLNLPGSNGRQQDQSRGQMG